MVIKLHQVLWYLSFTLQANFIPLLHRYQYLQVHNGWQDFDKILVKVSSWLFFSVTFDLFKCEQKFIGTYCKMWMAHAFNQTMIAKLSLSKSVINMAASKLLENNVKWIPSKTYTRMTSAINWFRKIRNHSTSKN